MPLSSPVYLMMTFSKRKSTDTITAMMLKIYPCQDDDHPKDHHIPLDHHDHDHDPHDAHHQHCDH